MKDVIEKGYAVRVPENQPNCQEGKLWYIPHHIVCHPPKRKLQVVFDCCASFQGTSLNDERLLSPDLANPLVGALTRFRKEVL